MEHYFNNLKIMNNTFNKSYSFYNLILSTQNIFNLDAFETSFFLNLR